jgi:hypothetical protein
MTTLEAQEARTFRIRPVPDPGPLERKILDSWVR